MRDFIIGFRNYEVLFSDAVFYQALKNNIIWILSYLLIPIPIGFFIALGLEDTRPKGVGIIRVMFFLPMAISAVAVSLIWTWMYNPEWGMINTILRGIGLDPLARIWLGEPSLSLYSVIFASYWNFIPLIVIILGAGLTQIPQESLEASKIDGARYFQQIRYIIIPLMRPSFTIAMAMTVIFSLRVFDIVFVMTGGGPANASEVLANFMFQEAFRNILLGYGSSIAVVLTLVTLLFIILYLRQIVNKESIY